MNLRFEEEAKKEKRKKLIFETIRYLILVVIVIALAWCIINLCLKKVTMIGSSMENTLHSGQEVIVNTFFKRFVSPGRSSVIAFFPESGADTKERTDSSILIRRIVGLPGEKVKISGGYVYINGKKLEEDYEFDRNVSSGQADQDITLKEDEFFVLSDKRTDLDDSRSSSFTKVRSENIIGTVFLQLDPFGFIAGPEPEKSKSDENEEKSEE